MLLGHGMKIRVREIFDLMGLALRLQYMFLMIDMQQRWKTSIEMNNSGVRWE